MSQDCVFAGLPSQAATLNSDNRHLRLVLFQPIRQPIPEFSPSTNAEQVAMGHILHAPSKCQSVEKHPALCLPQCEACKEWLKWATARENLPVGAGFVCYENKVWLKFGCVQILKSSLSTRPTKFRIENWQTDRFLAADLDGQRTHRRPWEMTDRQCRPKAREHLPKLSSEKQEQIGRVWFQP